MISLSSVSGSARKFILFLVAGSILFLISQLSFPDAKYHLSSWPGISQLGVFDTDRNATLGVAKKLYVLSLPHRSDRRQEMEQLKKALGLKWKYIEALDMKDPLVGKVMDSVRAIRATNMGQFIWPAEMPPPTKHLSQWDTGLLSLSAKIPGNRPAEPLVCATNNNSIEAYQPDLPEFRILTPARISCWYSHTTVIETIANDNSLKDDDAVIVLEDDVDMELDIKARLKHLWTYLPKDWDIVYLGMQDPMLLSFFV
jgi:GR25 family glycosyltransferase involved in LPS biosynthesis